MALPMIETGYKPEFGLGAVYQGFNAGNADMSAQEELIKQFLANQRERQMQPIDVQQQQQNLDAGQYKTSPEYQVGMRDTISGQGMSNLAAGQTATALQPFKERTGRAELQTQFNQQDMLGQIGQMDQMLGVEQNPLTRMGLMKERERLAQALKITPEFLQKRELKETGTDSAEYIAELRAQQARQLADLKAANAQQKPMSLSQMDAHYRDRLAKDPNDAEATDYLTKRLADIQSGSASMGDITLDPVTKKLVTKRTNVGGAAPQQSAKPSLPQGWSIK